MEKAIQFTLYVAAGVVVIAPLAAVWAVTKGVMNVAEKVGIKLPGQGLAQKFQGKADEFGKRQKNKETMNALNGKGIIPGRGGRARRVFRRDLKHKALESGLTSAQAQFGLSDDKASKFVQADIQNQRNTNAANTASGQTYMNNLAHSTATNPAGVTSAAAANPYMKDALEAQQQKAIADAIKDVEISADIAPGDLTKMADMLTDALKKGDTVTARAMQNLLLKSGGKGIDTYRATMTKAERSNPSLVGSGIHQSLRQNILTNHSGVKGSAADVVKQATDGGSLASHSNAKGTWNLTDDELAGQKKTSLQFADSQGGISADQATRILSNPELSKKLNPETRTILEDVATRPAGTPNPPAPVI